MNKHLLWVAISVAFALIMPSTGQATTISYNTAADDAFSMYLSMDPYTAVGTPIATGTQWQSTYSGTATLNNISVQYLQVRVINTRPDTPTSFIGDFRLNDTNFHFANGTQFLLTNASDWLVSTTGFNASTNVATDYGANGMDPWGLHPLISSNAHWIGTDVWDCANGYTLYISVPIYSSVPLPSTVLLLGSGLLTLAGWRRFRKG